jgi:hypothetical protein
LFALDDEAVELALDVVAAAAAELELELEVELEPQAVTTSAPATTAHRATVGILWCISPPSPPPHFCGQRLSDVAAGQRLDRARRRN